MTTNTIDGITYFDAPETDGCEGCVAGTNSPLCAQLQQTGGSYNYCAAHEVIWLEQAKPEAKIKTITTASGTFQQAPVEGREYESLFIRRSFNMIKTVNGVQYWFRPTTPAESCDGCAGEHDHELCCVLGNSCHGGIWCDTDTVPQHTPRVNPDTKKHNEVSLAICNYQQLAQAIQQAGGAVEILETHTVPQLLETLARNNITIKATYDH